MREVSIRELGLSQYLISYGRKFRFQAAVERGCGYKASIKFAICTNIPKVKLEARHLDGRKVGKTSPMWFLAIDDAIQFVRERAVDDDFRKWFIRYADTLRELPTSVQSDTAPASPRPAQGVPEAPAAKPTTGVNISSELIDRIIVDLLALKQEITSA